MVTDQDVVLVAAYAWGDSVLLNDWNVLVFLIISSSNPLLSLHFNPRLLIYCIELAQKSRLNGDYLSSSSRYRHKHQVSSGRNQIY